MKHVPGCNCLDCHAVKFESLWSCGCSLCQDRYRLESYQDAPTPRKAGDSPAVPRSAVASVAAEPEGGL